MVDMDDRRDVYEKKFAHDANLMFKAEARACKIIGFWAADKLGLGTGADAEAYAKEVISSNLEEPGFDDVKRKIEADFMQKNIEFNVEEFNTEMEAAFSTAKQQILSESETA